MCWLKCVFYLYEVPGVLVELRVLLVGGTWCVG